MKTPSRFLAYVLLAAPSLTSSALAAEEEKAVIIELTQVPCQFIEREQGTNHGYRSSNIKDCEAINAKSGASRVKNAKPLQLKPGKYKFIAFTFDFPFVVNLSGTLEFSKALDQCVEGRGTQTLVIKCKRTYPHGGQRDQYYEQKP